MQKFKWSFSKTLEYMYYKKNDLEILNKVYEELEKTCGAYEKNNRLYSKWIRDFGSEEERLITNTFLNAQKKGKEKKKLNSSMDTISSRAQSRVFKSVDKNKRKRVQWNDL